MLIILDVTIKVFGVIGGLYAFYNIFLKGKFWKPNLYLNNGRLTCVNDGSKEIVVNITLVSDKKKWHAKRIRTFQDKNIQATNIIYPSQSREIEFDIEIKAPKYGRIEIQFQFGGKIINSEKSFDKNTSVLFINNKKMKRIRR